MRHCFSTTYYLREVTGSPQRKPSQESVIMTVIYAVVGLNSLGGTLSSVERHCIMMFRISMNPMCALIIFSICLYQVSGIIDTLQISCPFLANYNNLLDAIIQCRV